MTQFRMTILASVAVVTLIAGVAATAPHNWSRGLGNAAAASAAVASTESGVCSLSDNCP